MPPAARRTALRTYAPPRRTGPSPALKKAQAKLASLRSTHAKLRRSVKGQGGTLTNSAVVVGGGAASGFIEGFFPEGIMGFDPRYIVGGGLVAAGVWGVKGNWGTWLTFAGAGVLAAAAAETVGNVTANAVLAEEELAEVE